MIFGANVAHVETEAVLVEALSGLDVPKPAVVGRDLIADYPLSVGRLSEHQFGIDEFYSSLFEKGGEDSVGLSHQLVDIPEFPVTHQPEGDDMMVIDKRETEGILEIADLIEGIVQTGSLFKAENPFRGSHYPVADCKFERNLFCGAAQEVPRAIFLDKIGRNAAFFKSLEQGAADGTAADSLSFQDGALNAVKGGSGIAEMEPDNSGIIS